MTWEQLAGAIAFFLLVSGALWGIWWKISGLVDAVKKDLTSSVSSATALAALAREEVAQLRLHAAESFMTKVDMRESTEQLLNAINAIKSSVDGTNQRIDRMYDQPPRRAA